MRRSMWWWRWWSHLESSRYKSICRKENRKAFERLKARTIKGLDKQRSISIQECTMELERSEALSYGLMGDMNVSAAPAPGPVAMLASAKKTQGISMRWSMVTLSIVWPGSMRQC